MSGKTRRAKAPQQSLTIQIAASAEEAFAREQAAIEKQRIWARAVADSIERGDLPESSQERQVVAWILRNWAERIKAAKPPPKPGNPSFKKKLYDPDQVALLVGFRIAANNYKACAAIKHVADQLEVDDSTVAKIFRQRRAAVARWFADSNLAHRVGAILGE